VRGTALDQQQREQRGAPIADAVRKPGDGRQQQQTREQ
jgi:hypothetical protein